ncbi:peptidase C14 [Mucilaginibacter sp. PPCGB 2223]|uniref:caspase family protein n=1 Tax=Mucilaginibacter sp. PPCGB 2223 TaxID=1886027 RepID=UPI000826BF9A|nr:caspase family protein [Mucilaginibacter sp. PPCGB 2223]OCX50327.1 peptidase C14 [Mucilaginibacter sp. PPCGB 2223]
MRKALIIGINDYPGAPLTGCINDATSIAGILERNGDGSPNFDIKTILGPPQTVTRALIRSEIRSLFEGTADVALLYFSGHGLLQSNSGYIVTSDYENFDEGVPMDEILKLANKSKAKDRIIIFDCCHAGNVGNSNSIDDLTASLGEGMTILTACHNFETSLERNGRGVFTSLITDGLQGGAADIRGNITPGSLYSYVDEALGAWDQRPIFKTNITRFTPLRKIAPKIPLEIIRKITTYFNSPTDEHSLDPSYEFTSTDAKQDKVEIFKNLQKFVAVGLVAPVGEEHMYFAAINNKSCKLTAMGYQYWRLVKENKI